MLVSIKELLESNSYEELAEVIKDNINWNREHSIVTFDLEKNVISLKFGTQVKRMLDYSIQETFRTGFRNRIEELKFQDQESGKDLIQETRNSGDGMWRHG